MGKISAVHQGYELYGSDRSFIQCLEDMRRAYPNKPIDVVIPRRGDLYDFLIERGFSVSVEDIWVLRKSLGLKLIARLFELPSRLWAAHRRFKKSDIVYINTSVVADYLLVARLHRGKAVAHIREIPTAGARLIIRTLVKWSRAYLIFNSKATEGVFSSGVQEQTSVVYNGVEGPDINAIRAKSLSSEVNVLILGRINDWKGQDLFIEALIKSESAIRDRIRLKIAGDTFGSSEQVELLKASIRDHGLERMVTFEGFVRDPAKLFEWCDVVVVPSRKPEPFGRVAIEAMAWAKPVIAAAHGGLTEIVEGGRTGLLFRPNDVDALVAAIGCLANNPKLAAEYGRAGRVAYEAKFTTEAHGRALIAALNAVPGMRAR